MANKKRYYWLKLQKDFFKSEIIKRLRRLENGDTLIIIYFKLLLESLESDGKLFYEGIEDDYISEIALLIDEDVADVKRCVDELLKMNVVKVLEDKTLIFENREGGQYGK